MTDERLKIFRPLGEQIIHILESALGSGQHTKPDSQSFIPKPAKPEPKRVKYLSVTLLLRGFDHGNITDRTLQE
jgi:hypothetical protein